MLCLRFLLILASTMSCVACGANQEILKSGRNNVYTANSPADQMTSFEKELEEFRTANFRYIFVLRRKDGTTITADDRKIIKAHTSDAERRVSADNGLAFIIGTNSSLKPTNLAAIKDHFAVESYSADAMPSSNTALRNSK